jgi:hypothetical protein
MVRELRALRPTASREVRKLMAVPANEIFRPVKSIEAFSREWIPENELYDHLVLRFPQQ